ncbi:Uncharacterised protein [Yersinia massiliensis]|nr:Uncharacterised protein [Yersinia massiliensis]
MVIGWDFQIEALEAQGSLPSVSINHKDWQASLESTSTQAVDTVINVITASQQDGTNLNAIHGGQTGRNQYVRAVCGSDQQRAWTEVFQHMRDTAGAECHRLHAASVDIAFVNNAGIQVLRHIDSASCNQLEAPGHAA